MKKIEANAAGYRNVAYGAAFNVNDDLSISYGRMESKKGYVSQDSNTVIMEIDSYQIAYTMGGATIKIAETESTNNAYSAGTTREATTVALSLAF